MSWGGPQKLAQDPALLISVMDVVPGKSSARTVSVGVVPLPEGITCCSFGEISGWAGPLNLHTDLYIAQLYTDSTPLKYSRLS
jgi:hypothetical protein